MGGEKGKNKKAKTMPAEKNEGEKNSTVDAAALANASTKLKEQAAMYLKVLQPPNGVVEYLAELPKLKTLDQFFELNRGRTGSSCLNLDKFATGILFGFCSGYAARRAFRLGAVVCGVGFMSLQCLNYAGYITVDWARINQQVTDKMDLNKDGRLDDKDFGIAREKLMKVLTYGLPSAGGFSAGFYWGIRSKWP